MRPSCFKVYVLGENDRMGSSLAGKPENRSWARLWMKKLNLVATLPRLDSISLERRGVEGWKERNMGEITERDIYRWRWNKDQYAVLSLNLKLLHKVFTKYTFLSTNLVEFQLDWFYKNKVHLILFQVCQCFCCCNVTQLLFFSFLCLYCHLVDFEFVTEKKERKEKGIVLEFTVLKITDLVKIAAMHMGILQKREKKKSLEWLISPICEMFPILRLFKSWRNYI